MTSYLIDNIYPDLECKKCTLMAVDATKENFLHQTTVYRSKIKPTLTLSSNIHYQNYGHQGLFPVITSRLTQLCFPIGRFFVV